MNKKPNYSESIETLANRIIIKIAIIIITAVRKITTNCISWIIVMPNPKKVKPPTQIAKALIQQQLVPKIIATALPKIAFINGSFIYALHY